MTEKTKDALRLVAREEHRVPCALSAAIELCDYYADRLRDINGAEVTSNERRSLVRQTVEELETAIRSLKPRGA